MTEAEAVWLVLDAFPSLKVESCLAGTQQAVMVLAIRRQNADRGPERSIGTAPTDCRMSALRSPHGTEADGTPTLDEAPDEEGPDGPNLFAQAV